MLTPLLTETNPLLKNRKRNEDFHPGAYGDEGSNDGDNDDGVSDVDIKQSTDDVFPDLIPISKEYKKKHKSPLYKWLRQLYDETQNSLPELPRFEKVVADKKEQGKPTQGVQTERQEFLKKYGC